MNRVFSKEYLTKLFVTTMVVASSMASADGLVYADTAIAGSTGQDTTSQSLQATASTTPTDNITASTSSDDTSSTTLDSTSATTNASDTSTSTDTSTDTSVQPHHVIKYSPMPPATVTVQTGAVNVAIAGQTAITGTVTDTNGDPVVGATVDVTTSDGNLSSGSATTDANGQYSVVFTAPQTNETVTLTATVDGTQVTASTNLNIVGYDGKTPTQADSDAVAADKAALTSAALLNANDAIDDVKTSLTLPATGAKGSSIVWTSNNTNVINTNGAVTQPKQDTVVTLTATLSKGSAQDQKTFSVTVKGTVAILAGTLLNADGSPIAGGVVTVRGSNNYSTNVTTDQNGRFEFDSLDPTATYTVTPSDQKYDYTPQTGVKVALGQMTTLNIQAPTATTGAIRGKVTFANGSPMNGIKDGIAMTIVGSGGAHLTASVDANGNYELDHVSPAQTYTITLSDTKYDYAPAQNVIVVAGKTTTQDFSPPSATTGAFQGTLLFANGSPMTGVNTTLTGPNNYYQAFNTDANGQVEYDHMTPNVPYTLKMSDQKYDYATQTVQVSPGQTTSQTISPPVATTGAISGKVTLGDGTPLAGFGVQLKDQNGNNVAYVTTSDRGVYEFDHVDPSQNFSVLVTGKQYTYQQTDGVTVKAGSTTTCNFVPPVALSGMVSGQVTDSNGNPVQNLRINLVAADSTTYSTANSSSSGDYEFDRVTPGTYQMVLPDFNNTVVQSVTVTAGQQTTFNFHASGTTPASTDAYITGVVTDAAGRPMAGAAVYVTWSNGAFTTPKTTDANGRYQIDSLPTNTVLTVHVNDSLYDYTPVSNVTVTQGKGTEVDFNGSAAISAAISGRVLDEDGNPVRATVQYVGTDGSYGSVFTDANGFYQFNRMPVDSIYTISVSDTKTTYIPATNVALKPGQTSTVMFYPASALTGVISGKVTDQDGNPMINALVALTKSDGTSTNVQTDKNGFYQFVQLATNVAYSVQVIGRTYIYAPQTGITLTPGQTKDVSFNPPTAITGNLTGSVLDANGHVVQGITVQLTGNDGSPLTSTLPDQNGNYKFTGLSPTVTYTLSFSSGKYQYGSITNVQVTAGQTTTKDFTPSTASDGVISGVVKDKDGNPVSSASMKLIGTDGSTFYATANNQGVYEFDHLRTDVSYIVQVVSTSANVYIPQTNVTVQPGQTTTVNFDPLTSQFGAIYGKVTDANGVVIPNATLTLKASDGSTKNAAADANGMFNFSNLSTQYTYAIVGAAGQLYDYPVNQDIHLIAGQVDSITVTVGAATTGAISGKIKDVNGNPLPWTPVSITGADPNNPIWINSQSDGTYIVGHLPANQTYSVKVYNGPLQEQVAVIPGQTTTVDLTSSGSTSYSNLTGGITVSAGASSVAVGGKVAISGKVTALDGTTPVKGVTVQLSCTGGGTLDATTVTADANGEFTTWLNAPKTAGSMTVTATTWNSTNTPFTATTTVAVVQTGVTGSITYKQTGEAAQNTTVKLVDSNGNVVQQVASSWANGTSMYTIYALPGTYTLQATDSTTGFSTTQSVTIPSGPLANVELKISQTGIEGVVQDGEGNYIAANIQVADPNGNVLAHQSVGAGYTYDIYLPDGTYVVTTTDTAGNSTTQTVTVTDAGMTALSTVVTDSGITGIVTRTHSQNTPLSADVYVYDANQMLIKHTVTDWIGRYTFYVPAGTYTVVATDMTSKVSVSQTVTVGDGTIVKQDLAVPISGFNVKVQDLATGAGVRASLAVYDATGTTLLQSFPSTTSSASSGIFTVYLPAGTYVLKATDVNSGYTDTETYDVNDEDMSNVVMSVYESGDTGSFLDKATNSVLSGTVQVYDQNNLIVAQAPSVPYTYAVYKFYLPAGTYTLVGTDSASHQTIKVPLTIADDQILKQDLVLARTGITGNVTNQANNNISNATVQLLNGSGKIVAQTNSIYGNYSLYAPAGVYTLKVTDPSTGNVVTRQVTIQDGQMLTVNVSTVASNVTGVVKNIQSGTGVRAFVQVFDSNQNLVTQTWTGTDGSYQFALPAGTYTFKATAADPNNAGTSPFSNTVTQTVPASQSISVPIGISITGVTGVVTNQTTGDLDGYAFIELMDSQGNVVSSAWTNAINARYLMYVPVGTYSYVAMDGGTGVSKLGTVTMTDGQTITQDIAIPILNLDDAAAVAAEKAVLQDATILSANPDLAHVTQDLSFPNMGMYGTKIKWASSDPTLVSTSGKVTRGATTKQVTLTATISGGSASDTKSFTVTVIAPPANVTLTAASANAAVGGGTTLSGTVTDAMGNPLADVPVSVSTDIGSVPANVTTDANGNFTAPFSSPNTVGTANIVATVVGAKGQTLTANATIGIVAADMQIDVTNTAGGAPVPVRITVKDNNGNVVNDNTQVYTSTVFLNLPAGSYTVTVNPFDSSGVMTTGIPPQTVTVANGQIQNVPFLLDALTVAVRDKKTNNAVPAQLTVKDGNDTTLNTVGVYDKDYTLYVPAGNGTYHVTVAPLDPYPSQTSTFSMTQLAQVTDGQATTLTVGLAQVLIGLTNKATGSYAPAQFTVQDAYGNKFMGDEPSGNVFMYLPDGSYTVGADAWDSNHQFSVPLTPQTLTITGGTASPSSVEFDVDPVNVSVTDSTSSSALAALITVKNASNNVVYTQVTTPATQASTQTGNETLYLPAGSYTVEAVPMDSANEQTSPVSQSVSAVDGTTAKAAFSLTPLTIHVTETGTGIPVPYSVTIKDNNGNIVNNATTNHTGDYTLYVPAGDYTASVLELDANGNSLALPVTQSVHVTGGTAASLSFSVLSDKQAVAAEVAELTVNSILEGNTAPDSVQGDLSLPTQGIDGTSITWSSNNTAIVGNDGKVTQPDGATSGGDASVTLMATVSRGTQVAQVSFTLTVKAIYHIGAPTGLAADNVSDSGWTLSWAAPSGPVSAASYNIYANNQLVAQNVTGTSYTFTGQPSNATFVLTVTAVDADGNESPASSPVTVTTLLPVPTGLNHQGVTSTGWTESWAATAGASSYNVYVDGTLVANVPGTSYTFTGMQPGTSYYVTVSALVGSSNTESPASTADTVQTLLSAPTGLIHLSLSSTDWTESWTAVPGAISYNVYLNGTLVANVTDTSYVFSGLQPATNYDVTVAAVDNSNNEGLMSAIDAVQTLLEAPTGVTTSNMTNTGWKTTWGAVTGAVGYDIYVNGSLAVANVTGTTYTFTGQTSGFYAVRVTAVDALGRDGDFSDIALANTALSIPTGLNHQEVTSTGWTESWTASTGANSYNVYVNGTLVANVLGATSYTFIGMQPGASYTVTVTAMDPFHVETDPSAVDNVQTLLAAPTGVTVDNITFTGWQTSWSAVSGAVRYNIYVNGQQIATGITSTSYQVTGELVDSNYEITIAAVDTSGVEGTRSTVYKMHTNSLDAPVVNLVHSTDTTVTGKADVGITGLTVTVLAGSTVLGTGQVASDGTFSVHIPAQKASTTLTVRVSDTHGHTSPFTTSVVIGDDCFIATAAFGSKFEPNVVVLRQFRDKVLIPTRVGLLFVRTYYRVSPPIAAHIADHEWKKRVVRLALSPLVRIAKRMLREQQA